MLRLRHKLLIQAFRMSDQISMWLSLTVAIAIFGGKRGQKFLHDFTVDYHPMSEFMGVGLVGLVWVGVFLAIVRYDANRFTSLRISLLGVAKATLICSFLLLGIAEVFKFEMITPMVILGHWLVSTLAIGVERLAIRQFLAVLRKSGHNRRNVILVGVNTQSIKLAETIERRQELGYHIQGFAALDSDDPLPKSLDKKRWKVVSDIKNLLPYLEKGIIDEVMVSIPLQKELKEIYDLLTFCQQQGIVIRIVPDTESASLLNRIQVEEFEGQKVITFFREKMLWQLLAKRLLDISVSVVLLIVLSPILLIVAISIKLTSAGPAIFCQDRVGMNKRIFKMYKFRSMIVDAEQKKQSLFKLNEMTGPVFKIKNDPRITSVGKFIRKISLDEFPQLWNVIKGEMSLVGPRPPLPSEVDKYERFHRRRLAIKPGITCLWQVGGRNNVSFEKWMELDQIYCENWSFWLDLKILLKTIPVILIGKGAS